MVSPFCVCAKRTLLLCIATLVEAISLFFFLFLLAFLFIFLAGRENAENGLRALLCPFDHGLDHAFAFAFARCIFGRRSFFLRSALSAALLRRTLA